MIACIDVSYRPARDDSDSTGTWAQAACVVAETWASPRAHAEYLRTINEVEDYVPGQFFRRELPCVLAVLQRVAEPITWLVIDGYVTLDAAGTVGMGGHLYELLGRRVPVIGVAKNPFAGAPAIELLRGTSQRPLYVTALGVTPADAADHVAHMHGQFRLPTLLKRVDRLCRDGV